MRKHFLLALPAAAMLLITGCANCNTCVAPVEDCAPCAASAPAHMGGEVAGDVVYTASSAPVAFGHEIAGAGVYAAEGVVHGVENAVQSVGHVFGLASTGAANANVETLSAEAYQTLIASGKVNDPSWRAPGGVRSVEVVEAGTASMVATIPSRFQPIAAEAATASVAVQVDATPALPLPAAALASAAEEDEMSVASTEVAITSDELSTPALMNAAALREAGIARGGMSGSSIPHIPAMPLPEGWDYIHDQEDLGSVPAETVEEQYFSDAGLGGTADI